MIAIVDYKAGNLTSVRLALAHIGVESEITGDLEGIEAAERVIFPGVGAAGAAMSNLKEMKLRGTLEKVIQKGTPFLGICVGMQVLFTHSEEDGGTDCLGLIAGNVKRFVAPDKFCKIPQMGWNTVKIQRQHPIFDGIEDESEFYFVHSYYPVPDDSAHILGETQHADARFASVVGRDNMVAAQFHPERSGRVGLKLLQNFSSWDGKC